MSLKKLCFLLLLITAAGCAKNNKTFTLKTIRLDDYRHNTIPAQGLYLKIYGDPAAATLAQTASYPSELTLPAVFTVSPALPMTLYKNACTVQLWGETTGYISSCSVDMHAYKIVFPIDMEVKSDSLDISLQGSWQ
ncbi:hypothetical protein B0I18_106227 [Taibaiella chishuiensis]|uniref:Lipoprotein n=1 Tax=Taibaiella chishuiensis TaxID=1434707 RepID=A0A2P8D1W5_9BACT|nr:hypothetical protein B0I18_106227 [Taibaiella chishuiensis]